MVVNCHPMANFVSSIEHITTIHKVFRCFAKGTRKSTRWLAFTLGNNTFSETSVTSQLNIGQTDHNTSQHGETFIDNAIPEVGIATVAHERVGRAL